ncbi:hypothetical protein [Streptomyces sp. NPDC002602]|uniref:hypothetical protein n=1 Tax=Streptomyces sp. NPDC002602 TaxID=3364654 RepID=UPI00369FFD91
MVYRAVRSGVGSAHVLDGREPRAVLRAVLGGPAERSGTTVVPDRDHEPTGT